MHGARRMSVALGVAGILLLTTIIACGGDGPTPPSDSGSIEIDPTSLTIGVGGLGFLTATVTNATGEVVANAPVSWVSRTPAIATVDDSGRVSGISLGVTKVVAKSGALSDSVNVTVAASAGCGSVVNANTFDGTLQYDWVFKGSDGAFVVDAEYHGSLKATLTRLSTTPFSVSWSGDISGTASFKETRNDPTTPGSTTTLQGEGAIVPILGQLPKMTLIVDVATCTYQLNAGASLNEVLTDPNGTKTRSDNPVTFLHARTGRPLGTTNTIVPADGAFDGHSTAWSALHFDKDAFVPLGLSTSLTASSDAAIGRATVTWILSPK